MRGNKGYHQEVQEQERLAMEHFRIDFSIIIAFLINYHLNVKNCTFTLLLGFDHFEMCFDPLGRFAVS